MVRGVNLERQRIMNRKRLKTWKGEIVAYLKALSVYKLDFNGSMHHNTNLISHSAMTAASNEKRE